MRPLTSVVVVVFVVDLLVREALSSSKEGVPSREYLVDNSRGVGRRFDGIGAISGGGATSKLLVNYPEPQRSQILDYLFKPHFGASLQILKVEIGGDSQSTDGSESSHMHTEDDENYNRGYEWWLMKEAKKRNPAIKFYGLPWTFPGWVGNGVFDPFHNRTKPLKYILNWINGAKTYHDLDISYIGIWNERYCDIEYIKLLRRELDASGLHSVQIVAPDSMSWSMVQSIHSDRDLAAAVDIVGVHYYTVSPDSALALDRPIWESEGFSARNDMRGGACWARVLNEGYVRGFITGYIAWNLIASYYDGLPYSRSSIMTANEPWSGHYEVTSPVWTTAHLTQFVDVGWTYLTMERGVGNLTGNGTYIALTSPDQKHLTIVVQSMDPRDVPCFYPMPKFTVAQEQIATFRLSGTYANIKSLNVWHSAFNISRPLKIKGEHFKKRAKRCTSKPYRGWCDSSTGTLFQRHTPIKVVDGRVTLRLKKNEVYTLTTMETGNKGAFPQPIPESKPFPIPYEEDFERYNETEEPFNFAQQSGSFEVHQARDAAHGKVMVQVTTDPPVDTCRPERMPAASNLIGDFMWKDVNVQADVYIEPPPEGATSVFLGARVNIGGCWSMYANGFYLWLFPQSQNWTLTGNFTRSVVYGSQPYKIEYEKWYTLGLVVEEEAGVKAGGWKGHTMLSVTALIDNKEVFNILLDSETAVSQHGFIGIGPGNHGRAQFDNFKVLSATSAEDPRLHADANPLEEQLAELMTENVDNTKPMKIERILNQNNVLPKNWPDTTTESSLHMLLRILSKHDDDDDEDDEEKLSIM